MRIVLFALPLLFAASLAHAAPVVVDAGARLVVDGDSTVRRFSCEATKPTVQLTGTAEKDKPLVEQLAQALKTVKLDLPVKALDCGNGTMNDHMRDALLAEKHEKVQFAMTRYELGAAKGSTVPLKVVGKLTLAGETRPVTIDATATATDDGRVRIEGAYPLNMTEWGVKPPKLMLGTLKVRDTVQVRFELALKQQ